MRHQLLTGTTSDIKQFVGDSLLTTLVVLQVEFSQELIGIIGGCLHGNHTGCVLRGIVVEQSRVEQQVGILRKKLCEHSVHVGLHKEVVVERLHVLLFRLLLAFTTLLQILLRLLRSNDAREVALVIGIQLRLDIDGREGFAGKNM